MEDKDLEKVTKMLERGGTMLAKHCECGAPLFKYQGKVVCPVCDAKKQERAEEQARLAVPVETKPAVSPQAVEPVGSTPVMDARAAHDRGYAPGRAREAASRRP